MPASSGGRLTRTFSGRTFLAGPPTEGATLFVRVTRGRYRPSRFESVEKLASDVLLPALRRMPGFRGFTGAADRAAGTLVAISYWETREQADAVGTHQPPFENLGVVLEPAQTYEVVVQD